MNIWSLFHSVWSMVVAVGIGVSVLFRYLKLGDEARKWLQQAKERRKNRQRDKRRADYARVTGQGQVDDILTLLYPDPHASDVFRYRLSLGESRRDTGIVTRPDWIGLSFPLVNGKFSLRDALSPTMIAEVEVRRIQEQAKKVSADFCDNPIYRPLGFQPHAEQGNFEAVFAIDSYARGLAGGSGAEYELVQALIKADGDFQRVYKRRRALLGMRQKYLSDIGAVLALERRVAIGGVDFLLALRRPAPDDDFGLFVMRRSDRPLTNPGLLALFTGVHQPESEASKKRHLNLTHSVFREVYEELFEGEGSLQAEESLKEKYSIEPDEFWEKTDPVRQLKRLLLNGSVTLELVCFGLSLTNGDCEFGILLAVNDASYYDDNYTKFKFNWESKGLGVPGKHLVSSTDAAQLADLVANSDWVGRSLFVFVESLKRLHALNPELVKLPESVETSPFKAGGPPFRTDDL